MALGCSQPVVFSGSTANATSYAASGFTPSANSLLVVIVHATNTVAVATMAGGSLAWTLAASQAYGPASEHTAYLFWALTGASPASCTLTFDCTGDAATGCLISPFQWTGTFGASPIRQTAKGAGNGTSATGVFAGAVLTGNGYCGAAANDNNDRPNYTQPSGWTKTMDAGYNTPGSQGIGAYRVGGETGTSFPFAIDATEDWGAIYAEISETTSAVRKKESAMLREVRKNEAIAAKRRIYFDVRTTDGLTPAAAETSGQPQISINGAAWTNTGIGALATIVPSTRGRYYADLTQASVSGAAVGDIYESRYLSGNTIESPGDCIVIVPNLSIQGNVSDSTPSVSSIRVYPFPSPTNNEFIGQVMLITGGVNAGKTRKISAYVAATGDFQFTGSSGDPDAPWNVACGSGDPVEILGRVR